MTLTILVDENIPAVEHCLGDLYTDGTVSVRRAGGRALGREQLAGVDALLVRSVTKVNKSLLAGTGVRFVGTATSGVDHIDRDYLRDEGIGFAHAPGSNANSVVEYVLAAIGVCGDRLEQLLDGGCVGIVGYGVIGKAVARRFAALNIRYKVYDPWLEPTAITCPATLEAVLACDVVTLHAELTSEQPWPSYHLLDADALAAVPGTSLLINASRGPVVDNQALLSLLEQKDSPQVILDVWEGEPAINHELLGRVAFATPHIAGYSLDGKLLATTMLCEALTTELNLPWQAPQGSSGAPPSVSIPPGIHGAALLRYLLLAHYDITVDDSALRSVTSRCDPVQAAKDFDLLRRNYPERRELSGSTIGAAGLNAADTRLLAALGCKPQAHKVGEQ